MRTHGLWLAVTVSSAAAFAAGTARAERPREESAKKSSADEADRPAYVDSNVDDKAVRAGHKAERVAERAGAHLSDAWITSKVKAQLMADDKVDGSAIEVETSKRIVYLRGRVGSHAESQRAIELTKGTQGVYGVLDELAVGAPAGLERTKDRTPSPTGNQARRASTLPSPADVTGTGEGRRASDVSRRTTGTSDRR